MTRWRGKPTAIERQIGLPDRFGGPVADPAVEHGVAVTENDVMRVAAAWSIDLTTLVAGPAIGRPALIQLPVPAENHTQADHTPVVVDITDLIASGATYEEANIELIRRLDTADEAPID